MIKISKSLKFRTNQNDTVLVFDPDRDFFHEFNKTASEMFLLIKEGNPNEKILEILTNKYDVDTLIIEKELKSFIKKIVKLGIAEET